MPSRRCSVKPCWTLTQQRRCRILQTDDAVEGIGWKKVRKWMQAVRCRLCGETQVLRDLTKGCFNLEHWWRHLRVRHGIKRDEEIEDKGEEKYKTLPIKDHVCVGACSTCGESGAAISLPQRPSPGQPSRGELSNLSSLSSVETTFSTPPEPVPVILPSIPRNERRSPCHTPGAGPSNVNVPPPHSALYTLANARPQCLYESVTPLTTFPIPSCRDQPPPIPLSWAPYIDHSSDPSPLAPLSASHRPSMGNSSTSTPQLESTRSKSSAYTMPTPRLPPTMTAPQGARNRRNMDDTSVFIHRRSPTAAVAFPPTGTSTAPATRTRPAVASRSTSARTPVSSTRASTVTRPPPLQTYRPPRPSRRSTTTMATCSRWSTASASSGTTSGSASRRCRSGRPRGSCRGARTSSSTATSWIRRSPATGYSSSACIAASAAARAGRSSE